jgi:hypothetical protein
MRATDEAREGEDLPFRVRDEGGEGRNRLLLEVSTGGVGLRETGVLGHEILLLPFTVVD